jgi:3-hydroxyacyl-[acyl-carrier-protein] dehydratase
MTEAAKSNPYRLNVDQIQKFLPHRAPFLMIDRVLEIHPVGDLSNFTFDQSKVGVKVSALKSVSFNEPHFQGHFPGFAIMPGVLIVEAMAQAASFSIYPYMMDDIAKISRSFECILVGVDNVRFRKPVVPGDQIRLDSEVTRVRGRLWGFKCQASVDGQLVAEADLLANLIATERK